MSLCAPWVTRVRLVTPDGCVHPTPAIPRPRGVEDAAPYGRQRNVGISIVGSRRVNAANLLPRLGSPERGAVAALCAVTEGLGQRWCARKNGARAVPAKLHTLGGGREASAPFASWSKSVTPAIRANVAPAITQPWCTEDGAPYGQQRNERCSMEHNGCRQSQTINSSPPHGFAETHPIEQPVGGGVFDAPSVG